VKAEDVRTVGVVGCGLMGSGIVEVVARSARDVVFVEGDDELVAGGRARIERSLAAALDHGKLEAAERDAALGRIRGTTAFEDLAGADLVIEAATEDRGVKLGVFRRLDEVTRDEVVLASNTSSIPIVDLATATGRPDRVVGMHFFNPVPVMALIELVRAITTSNETVAFAEAFGASLGKQVVTVRDRAGFVANTLLIPYLCDAIRMVEDGYASPEDVDAVVTLGLRHPMGPLALVDLVGLDTTLQIAEVLFEEFREPRFAPPPLLRRMVAAGRLGRKSGRGFYTYGS
jgi:3-hydroxybutyryl-CoA dehydrogenase